MARVGDQRRAQRGVTSNHSEDSWARMSSSRDHVLQQIVTADSESAHMNDAIFISNSVGRASNENDATPFAEDILAGRIAAWRRASPVPRYRYLNASFSNLINGPLPGFLTR